MPSIQLHKIRNQGIQSSNEQQNQYSIGPSQFKIVEQRSQNSSYRSIDSHENDISHELKKSNTNTANLRLNFTGFSDKFQINKPRETTPPPDNQPQFLISSTNQNQHAHHHSHGNDHRGHGHGHDHRGHGHGHRGHGHDHGGHAQKQGKIVKKQSLPQIFFDKVSELRQEKNIQNGGSPGQVEESKSDISARINPFHDKEFDIDDIESLQDASIDKDLLNDYFINSRFEFEQTKKDYLMKHARRYGYIKIPPQQFQQRKQNLTYNRNREFIQKKKDLETQILTSQKQLRDQLTQMDTDGNAFKAVAGFMQLKMIQNKLEVLQSQQQEMFKEEKVKEYVVDLDDSQDHELNDLLLAENLHYTNKILTKEKNNHKSTYFDNYKDLDIDGYNRKTGKVVDVMLKSERNVIIDQKTLQSKWTIDPTTALYRCWHLFRAANCLYTSICYPIYTMNRFPQPWEKNFITLLLSEFYFFIDIIVNFFLQEIDEEGNSKMDPLGEIAVRNLHSSSFKFDMVALIPWGYFMTKVNDKNKYFWVVKAIRIGQLNYYLRDKMIMPMIRQYIQFRQREFVNHPKLKYDINHDTTFLMDKIYMQSTVKLLRLVFQFLFIAFIVGVYWYIFSQTIHEYLFDEQNEFTHQDLHDHATFVYNPGNWNLRDETSFRKVLISTYYGFTTLSTIGLGDFYPISDHERFVAAFLMLFGVLVQSFIMEKLAKMLINAQNKDNEIEQLYELNRFINVLMMFNGQQQINPKIQADIRNFFAYKWDMDKNNFMSDPNDKAQFYDQLPNDCQRQLYTNFVYKDFLFRFRRFFSFRVPEPIKMKEEGCCAHHGMTSRSNTSSIVKGKIKNENLKRLQRKVALLVSVSAAFKKARQMKKKYTKDEIESMTDQIRKRVEVFEEKRKKSELESKIAKSVNQSKVQYEYAEFIKYPFLTFDDDAYSQFMTLIMNNLETRQYYKGEMIAHELDECLEVLFVLQGRYNVGFEVNKQQMYRRQFGHSTIIGGFSMCFGQRHNFLYRAHTNMICNSIRKKQWMETMSRFPDFYLIVKQKSLAFYFTKLFRPLINLKKRNIESYERRNDFNQVLTTNQSQMKEIKKFFHELFLQATEEQRMLREQQIQQSQNVWLIQTITEKLATAANIGLEITMKSEQLQMSLWEKVIQAIIQGKLKHQEKFVTEMYNIIIPKNLQFSHSINKMKRRDQDIFFNFCRALKNKVNGKLLENSYLHEQEQMSTTLGIFKEKFIKQLKLEGLEVQQKEKKNVQFQKTNFEKSVKNKRKAYKNKTRSMIQESKELIVDSEDFQEMMDDSESLETQAIVISQNQILSQNIQNHKKGGKKVSLVQNPFLNCNQSILSQLSRRALSSRSREKSATSRSQVESKQSRPNSNLPIWSQKKDKSQSPRSPDQIVSNSRNFRDVYNAQPLQISNVTQFEIMDYSRNQVYSLNQETFEERNAPQSQIQLDLSQIQARKKKSSSKTPKLFQNNSLLGNVKKKHTPGQTNAPSEDTENNQINETLEDIPQIFLSQHDENEQAAINISRGMLSPSGIEFTTQDNRNQ